MNCRGWGQRFLPLPNFPRKIKGSQCQALRQYNEDELKRAKTSKDARDLGKVALHVFAFLVTEGLFTTTSEPGTGQIEGDCSQGTHVFIQ